MDTSILSLESIPTLNGRGARELTRDSSASRRSFLKLGAVAAGGVGLAYLGLFRAGPASAAYYDDWTSTSSGPCGAGNYASGHTEAGIRCGPSYVCDTCCGSDGWHRSDVAGGIVYSQRPDECWAGVYDAWHWSFSDGHTYRCSDGYASSQVTTTKTICPWAVS
jgi:hypothetical protein